MSATQCDYCPTQINYGVTCWMIHVRLEETKIIKIACDACHESGKTQ